ncbi:RNA polymerase sigma factor [Novosphingobium sp. MBES04]|uniref:RNA polymerase sigma factor n=1 Tax=Novosphingobium sp. MBES04 TaxID=1206458 RepID=UPI00057DE332|nr:RNA polymerase sigma factor [Novosphingobium sp. MBES04]
MGWLREIDIWFGERVFIHNARHRAYALRLVREPGEAEDLVQEAYARLFALKDWKAIGDPQAFTMRIIHNLAAERFRRSEVVRLDQSALIQALDPADEQPAPDEIVAHRAELRRVAGTIETLPDRMREALVLRRIEGLPPRQVAEKMEISVSTVEKHLVKGFRLLLERLSEPGTLEKAEQSPSWEKRQKTEQI